MEDKSIFGFHTNPYPTVIENMFPIVNTSTQKQSLLSFEEYLPTTHAAAFKRINKISIQIVKFKENKVNASLF